MNKIVINLDSTALGSSGCILDLVRTVIGDPAAPTVGAYREKCYTVELVYGICVHAFIDTMYKTGGNYKIAGDKARHLFKTIPFTSKETKPWMNDERHLLTTCFNVWTEWLPKETTFDVLSIKQKCWKCNSVDDCMMTPDQKYEPCSACKGAGIIDGPATEVTFRILYYEDDYIQVWLCGTIDRLGKFKGGCYAIRDWKSTGSWDNNGYFEQYELSRQLRFYRLALRIMSEKAPDSILGQVGASHMGVMIDGIFLKANANDTIVKASDVFQLSKTDIDAFQRTLDDKIKEISEAIRTNYFPKQGILHGTCEKKFSKCRFWSACKSPDNVAQVLLGREFIRKPYNPLSFNT